MQRIGQKIVRHPVSSLAYGCLVQLLKFRNAKVMHFVERANFLWFFLWVLGTLIPNSLFSPHLRREKERNS